MVNLYKVNGFVFPVGDPDQPHQALVLEYPDSPLRICMMNSSFTSFEQDRETCIYTYIVTSVYIDCTLRGQCTEETLIAHCALKGHCTMRGHCTLYNEDTVHCTKRRHCSLYTALRRPGCAHKWSEQASKSLRSPTGVVQRTSNHPSGVSRVDNIYLQVSLSHLSFRLVYCPQVKWLSCSCPHRSCDYLSDLHLCWLQLKMVSHHEWPFFLLFFPQIRGNSSVHLVEV